jgi:predicted nucleic acid-binding protein
LRIEPAQLTTVTQNARQYRLDFDDAFVYTVAAAHGLTIVNFDSDFDRTPRGRKTPGDALAN